MSSTAHAFQSRRIRFWVTAASALVLVAGLVAVLVVFVGNTGGSDATPLSNKPAQTVSKIPNTPLEPAARIVAGRFIETAVQRKNLAEAYTLVGPELRQGLTLAQWKTGNIPVVPYLAAIGKAPIKVDYSHPGDALLEVLLLPKGNKVKPQIFFLEVKKVGRRWLVISWAPRSQFGVPAALND